MTQPTVSRLKELLFDQEAREIDALQGRIDALAATDRQRADELARRLDEAIRRIEALFERAGGDKELRASVARIIDGALRDAETTRHRDLADAMAPVVVRTVRAEIVSPQTQDQIAGSLYKKIGEMVRRYVASAMRDLMEGINRRLESGLTNNRLMLKLRSITTGRSMAELALADTQTLLVDEIYLIKRGSGELVHHWQRTAATPEDVPAGANRDTLISGFLTAITAFAEEAFVAEKSSLRAIDLDNHRIYMRGAPSLLIAAKCSGTAPGEIEAVLDAALIKVLDEHNALEQRTAANGASEDPTLPGERERLLETLAESIESGAAERAAENRRSRGGLRPLKLLAWLIALPLAAFLGWQAWIGYQTRLVQSAANAAIAEIKELAGYPVSVRVERGGRALWAVGLTPSEDVRARLRLALGKIDPAIAVTDTLGVLPQTDVASAIEDQRRRDAVSRAGNRLRQLAEDLQGAAKRVTDRETIAAFDAAARTVATAGSDIAEPKPAADMTVAVQPVEQAITRLQSILTTLTRLTGGPSGDIQPRAVPAGSTSLLTALDTLNDTVERIARQAAVLERAELAAREAARMAPLREQIASLTQRLEALSKPPTVRQRLEAFIRENAIFFTNNLELRDPAAAGAALDNLAALIKEADAFVRVVGYTDETGAGQRNIQLSQQRADAMLEELVRRGVQRRQLVAVGRATALDLAPRTGATSPSRRVEFELGFKGEESGSP